MRTVAVQPLNMEAFKKYGVYENMLAPGGHKFNAPPVEFFRDQVQLPFHASSDVSFSNCRVHPREGVIQELEYHSYAAEAALPLDGGVLLAVAPATKFNEPPAELVQIFSVPRGTLAVLRPGVWHSAPFSVGGECVNVLIVLPERTYANDVLKARLAEPVAIGIIEPEMP